MITDYQYRKLHMELSKRKTIEVSSAIAGMCSKTGRKYKNIKNLPSENKTEHTWRTRTDPFKEVWSQVLGKLNVCPNFEIKTIFHWLQRENPGVFQDGQLRTLQRKVKVWKAIEGPSKEVMFPQIHYPGDLCESDFTNMDQLGITINKEPFMHILYHFVLTYSNWEHVTICFSETMESLSDGLQNALCKLGGVPKRHRTDRLSAAVNNSSDSKDFTDRYKALLNHYKLKGEKIQAGKPNENGDVEQSHYRLKKLIREALILRGSSNFLDRGEYSKFLDNLLEQANENRKVRFNEELSQLKSLPLRRLDACKRIQLKVGPSSTINLLHNVYSVHSRLINERIEARVYSENIEIWYNQQKIDKFPRLKGKYKHKINYRHIIDCLIKKPGAFQNYRYRADLFPNSHFRMAFDYLMLHKNHKHHQEYLKILNLASKESESKVTNAINILLEFKEPISYETIKMFVLSKEEYLYPLEVDIPSPNLGAYDDLFEQKEEMVCN